VIYQRRNGSLHLFNFYPSRLELAGRKGSDYCRPRCHRLELLFSKLSAVITLFLADPVLSIHLQSRSSSLYATQKPIGGSRYSLDALR
jgi:hypothetical protein